MKLYKKIDLNTGYVLEDALCERPPLLFETVTETREIFDEKEQRFKTIEYSYQKPKLKEVTEGNLKYNIEVKDPKYIDVPVSGDLLNPKWDGVKWVVGDSPVIKSYLTEIAKESLIVKDVTA
jgi:hypothetical protein